MESTGTKQASVGRPLLQKIENDIVKGRLSSGKRIGSEYQLASENGISRNSVRSVISELVARGLVERVPGKGIYVRGQDSATRTVSVIVPSIAYSTHATITQSIQNYSRKQGLRSLVYDAHREIQTKGSLVPYIDSEEHEAAILILSSAPAMVEAMYKYRLDKKPLVVIGSVPQDPGVLSVDSDYFADGTIIGQKIAKLNHSKVAFMSANRSKVSSNQQMFLGLRSALIESGCPAHHISYIDIGSQPVLTDWYEPTKSAIQTLLKRAERPTAIACDSDGLAATVMRAISQFGFRIPEDISVVGFGGEMFCRLLNPPLATVLRGTEKMAELAVEMVIKQLVNSNCDGEHHAIKGVWQDGESLTEAMT